MTTVSNPAQVAANLEAVDSTALLSEILNKSHNGGSSTLGTVIGCFDGNDVHGRPLVSIEQLGLNAIVARTTIDMTQVAQGSDVVLAFAMGDPVQPLILGCLLSDAGAPKPSSAALAGQAQPHASAPVPTEILVDGERVVIRAEHEIELRCGDAAIILSSDGRIELRGAYITSKASATQRILGGSVNIN
jgi:Domain of unknown function (DUF6484)